jgi:type II secretory pathway pseudopilin PulG
MKNKEGFTLIEIIAGMCFVFSLCLLILIGVGFYFAIQEEAPTSNKSEVVVEVQESTEEGGNNKL